VFDSPLYPCRLTYRESDISSTPKFSHFHGFPAGEVSGPIAMPENIAAIRIRVRSAATARCGMGNSSKPRLRCDIIRLTFISGIDTGISSLPYIEGSLEARLLSGESEAIGLVVRWIVAVLVSPQFWSLRRDWPDMQQEVMARLIESLRAGRFDPSRNFRTYVQAVARYAALESMNRIRSRHEIKEVDETYPDHRTDPRDRTVQLQMARLALERSSGPCRALMLAYFYQQRSYEEIARSEGVPVGTVKSRLSRCLADVHRAFAQDVEALVPPFGRRSGTRVPDPR
jgi:RNA polymerase sigma factor (sigma-70 family)